jgi:aminoglycoside phosphotransferase (APT) family kinase protein
VSTPRPLTAEQEALLDSWFGGWSVEEDMSWDLQGIHVLRVRTPGGLAVVKASATDHHIRREIRAHRQMTGPLARLTPPRTPRLLHADAAAGLLATSWLPGRTVEGTPFERSPEAFRQAGELLALLHVPRETTNSYDPAALNKVGDFLARARGLAPGPHLAAAAGLAAAHRAEPRRLFATHGDYSPRNWVLDGDPAAGALLGVIDWGRAGYRPWVTDLVRLEHGWFQGGPDASGAPARDSRANADSRDSPDRQANPDSGAHDGAALRAAFYAGYGRDPAEEPGSWFLDNLLQALGTIVWSHDVGDPAFEEEGRRMLARILEWSA